MTAATVNSVSSSAQMEVTLKEIEADKCEIGCINDSLRKLDYSRRQNGITVVLCDAKTKQVLEQLLRKKDDKGVCDNQTCFIFSSDEDFACNQLAGSEFDSILLLISDLSNQQYLDEKEKFHKIFSMICSRAKYELLIFIREDLEVFEELQMLSWLSLIIKQHQNELPTLSGKFLPICGHRFINTKIEDHRRLKSGHLVGDGIQVSDRISEEQCNSRVAESITHQMNRSIFENLHRFTFITEKRKDIGAALKGWLVKQFPCAKELLQKLGCSWRCY